MVEVEMEMEMEMEVVSPVLAESPQGKKPTDV